MELVLELILRGNEVIVTSGDGSICLLRCIIGTRTGRSNAKDFEPVNLPSVMARARGFAEKELGIVARTPCTAYSDMRHQFAPLQYLAEAISQQRHCILKLQLQVP